MLAQSKDITQPEIIMNPVQCADLHSMLFSIVRAIDNTSVEILYIINIESDTKKQ